MTERDPAAEGSDPAGKVGDMARLEDLEARVTALEEQTRQSRQDAAAARILAGAADRDVSDFKQTLNGHTQVLNSLRETQIEQGRDISGLKTEVIDLTTEVRSGFTKINVNLEQMSRLIQRVIDKD
ncbi:hypothetical protein [Amycolatopsis kentuckyensis]|uniref:hypothetical protein n=1 Tax=Amycolatopsis kentuckyensis TaxID=218823 RepID=UPI001FC979DA|nr:hypothetical protein [Amycolatopsis kentuckyensis]